MPGKFTECNIDLLLSGSVQIKAAADTDQVRLPRFDMVAYTGDQMIIRGQQFPVVVDLKGLQGFDKNRPALRDHNPALVVGHTTRIAIEAGQLLAEGLISGTGECAEEVRSSADNGFPWQASIGARMLARQVVPAGETVTINGRQFTGPLIIARRASLGEISFVALGADDNTSARIAASAAKVKTMKFSAWLAAKGFSAAKLSPEQYTYLLAQYQASDDKQEDGIDVQAPVQASGTNDITATGDDDDLTQLRATRAAEVTRIAAVSEAARGHDQICAQAIREGWSVEKTELAVLRASRKPNGAQDGMTPFYINTGAGVTQQMVGLALTASAALSAGVTQDVAFQGADDRVKAMATSKQFRGASLHSIIGYVAASRGIHVTPGRLSEDDIRNVLNAERTLDVTADGYSTMSISGITENVMNKAMLQAYGDVPSVVSEIAYETDTNDFKQFKRYRLTASGAMQSLSDNGELKSITLQDESYANQLSTKGCIINIGRNIWINDDMGALVEIPTLIGRQAKISREKAVFVALLGNAGNFFGAGNKNYLSGAGSALAMAGLTSSVQKFMEQKDANGDPILLLPDRILVSPALLATADTLYTAEKLTGTSSKLDLNTNIHRGKYRPICSPFLGSTGGCGGNDTQWHMFGNPAGGFATVQVGYLRGQRSPTIERGEMPFNTLGMAMRAYFDFGVALHDYRCGVLNAGV